MEHKEEQLEYFLNRRTELENKLKEIEKKRKYVDILVPVRITYDLAWEKFGSRRPRVFSENLKVKVFRNETVSKNQRSVLKEILTNGVNDLFFTEKNSLTLESTEGKQEVDSILKAWDVLISDMRKAKVDDCDLDGLHYNKKR